MSHAEVVDDDHGRKWHFVFTRAKKFDQEVIVKQVEVSVKLFLFRLQLFPQLFAQII